MQPHRIKVGAGLILVSLDGLAVDWGIPEKGVTSLLATFSVPLIKLPGGDKQYVNLWSLEMALFEAGLPEGCRGSQEVVRAIHEAAAIVYGTLSKEVIQERVRMLARGMCRAAGKPVPGIRYGHRKKTKK